MKKFWKIFGITLGSLLAVVLIGVFIAFRVVLTPSRLTPIVRDVADNYITAQHEIGDVELTFFSTFPNLSVRVGGLLVVNPMEGSLSDTVLHSPEVIAKLDLMKLLKGTLIVDGLEINDVTLNGYIDSLGKANFDVLNLETDTLEEDTSAFTLPFEGMNLDNVALKINRLTFVSAADTISAASGEGLVQVKNVQTNNNVGSARVLVELSSLFAELTDLQAAADVKIETPVEFNLDSMLFNLSSANIALNNANLQIGDETYLDSVQIALTAAALANLNTQHYRVKNGKISYNDFALALNADVLLKDSDIVLDASCNIADWDIEKLLAQVPPFLQQTIKDLQASGLLTLQANAKGVYNNSQMPIADAHLKLADAHVEYASLPVAVDDIAVEMDAHLDMNDSTQSVATIRNLKAKINQSSIEADGTVERLLAQDMSANVGASFDVLLADIRDFLPKEMSLEGRAEGQVQLKGKINDLADLKLTKTNIVGDAKLTAINMIYDSLLVNTKRSELTFAIPNNRPTSREVAFLRANMNVQDLQFSQLGSLSATTSSTKLIVEASDLLSNQAWLKANVNIDANALMAQTDSMGVKLDNTLLNAFVAYNQKDTTAVPQVDADFKIGNLAFRMDTINAAILQPSGKAHLHASKSKKTEPALEAELNLNRLEAKMGGMAHIKTDALKLTAQAEKNSAKENILLQWNPQLGVKLSNGDIDYSNFASKIKIPNIDFNYSNREFNITEGTVLVGKSDFTLSGEIRNIDKWLNDEGDLRGELVLLSEYTDVPEIMSLTSGAGADETEEEESVQESQEPTTGDPYMVPKGVHLSLNTQISKALLPFINETAYDLGGSVTVNDGVLVIEEMGFICNAARLQLTAMYKTPRKNHLFVGLDYHMLDIDLERLVDMIPQVDTVLPMLRSFRGNAEFHLAAETYLNSNYDVKWSTTRGACSIAGHDLTLIDGQTFTTVAKLLNFKNKKAENQVDSISAEITLFKKEIDVYPFLVTMDKYKAAVGGRHNLDMTCNYHVSLLSPTYLGVNINGPMSGIMDSPMKYIKLEKAKYAQDFLPQYRGEVESQNQSLRKMIRDALKSNVEE